MEAATPKNKRRWYQFSLRALLIGVVEMPGPRHAATGTRIWRLAASRPCREYGVEGSHPAAHAASVPAVVSI
jgi:hypothetical protein